MCVCVPLYVSLCACVYLVETRVTQFYGHQDVLFQIVCFVREFTFNGSGSDGSSLATGTMHVYISKNLHKKLRKILDAKMCFHTTSLHIHSRKFIIKTF